MIAPRALNWKPSGSRRARDDRPDNFVHLAQLRLRDFRNYARLDAQFQPGFHLFLGDNAQGKTNLLEAIYLLGTLRSFRGAAGAQMIREGHTGYFIGAQIISQGDHEIKIYWSGRERKLSLDGRTIRRLTEYLGVFRCVVFCSEDQQLVKGPPGGRRRFLDLLLSQTHPTYLSLLHRYTQALRCRNALLRQKIFEPGALDSFSAELVSSGNELIKLRRQLLPTFEPFAREAYQRISLGAEELRLEYQSSVKGDFEVELRQALNRERVLRTTFIGPHRDDVSVLLNLRPADDFGSEGQKRSTVIALKMAQAEYLTKLHGTPPILLIDDVMGELDSKRRHAFLPLLQRVHQAQSQVFMTCTSENWAADLAPNLTRWEVKSGRLSRYV